jgi:NADH-quinone oxidoreductase subunit F
LELHLTNDQATAEERSAVDSLLGAPETGWRTGQRLTGETDQSAVAGVNLRQQLLPVLHSLQSRIGWLSPGGLNYVAIRLDVPPSEVHSVASFYDLFSLNPRPRTVLHVCDDIACLAKGSGGVCKHLEDTVGAENVALPGGRTMWRRSPCLGLCERAPAALLTVAGEKPAEVVVAPASAEGLEKLARESELQPGKNVKTSAVQPESLPQAGDESLRLLRRVGKIDPTNIQEFERIEGYQGLRRAMEIGPEAVVREVIESRLLGRGGAAFPTGKKWEAVLKQRRTASIHYVVCNADESEPGTFKDRIVMEQDPLAVLEGLTIAGFAVGAKRGYIYVRGEYPEALRRLSGAIATARTHGYLGDQILGTSFGFEIEVRRGAGAYICGEETALFNSIEGYRGEPRNKPPFPTQSGLFRQPTVVNNVETLINIPEIVLHGGAAYAQTGTSASTGHRLFCLSGHVVRPGVYEIPFGSSVRQLIEMAGGVGGTGKLQGVLLGGAAGSFLAPRELDMPLTFEGARAAGASLGSGVVMLFDDSVDLKPILARIAVFFRHESCGQCVPCRVGTVRQEEVLQRLIARRPNGSVKSEIAILQEVAQAMRDASICGLGQTASGALLSAIDRWSLFS